MCTFQPKLTWLKDFVRDESGSYTVEFVVWFPMFMFLFVIMFGFSVGMMRQTMILNEMNRVARAYALGTIATTEEAKERMDNFITQGALIGYQSTNSLVTLVDRNDIVELTVNIPLYSLIPVLAFVERFDIFNRGNIKMAAYYHVENH